MGHFLSHAVRMIFFRLIFTLVEALVPDHPGGKSFGRPDTLLGKFSSTISACSIIHFFEYPSTALPLKEA